MDYHPASPAPLRLFALAGLLTAMLGGCTVVGPTAISSGRLAYNEAITATDNQQILMVLVHNRYGERGHLLNVASVTANVSVTTSAGVQAGFGSNGDYAGNLVPFAGSDSAERKSAALWATTRAFFPDEFPNVELLSQFVISPVQLYSLGDQPLESLADLESRRVWALPGPLAAIGSAIGAGVVSTPAVESRDILSRGVVDASIGPEPHSVENMQLTGYIRSLTSFERPLYTSSFSMMMNSGTWGRISPEDQEAIRGVSGEVFARRAGAAWDAANVEVLQHFADAGVVTVRADAAFNADMQQSAAFLNDAWLAEAAAAGGDGAAALAFYRAAVED